MDLPLRCPLVSVVVPVYKVEAYLPRCLDSLVGQTYRNLEIVVVNDGSPDRCDEIMRAYAAKDDRIRMIFQENKGLGPARNAGIAAATGEFVCLVDSDDYVTRDYVARMMELAMRRNADVVVCNFFIELPSGVKIPFPLMTARRNLTGEEATLRSLDLLSVPTVAWNKLYRRSLFTARGLEFPSIYYEDVATISRILAGADRVAVTHKPLYHYCLRKSSIVGNFHGRNVRDYLHAASIVRRFIWDEGLWAEWHQPYLGFLRRIETLLVLSIMSRTDLPMRDRARSSRMVAREIKRLQRPPATTPRGGGDHDNVPGLDAETVFSTIVPLGQRPQRRNGLALLPTPRALTRRPRTSSGRRSVRSL